MLVAYGGDSADSKKQTVFSVAIVVGSSDQWRRFKPEWERRNGGVPFHAADCEAGWGNYKGIDRDVRTTLYRDLVSMLADSDLYGFSAAINIRHFNEGFADDHTSEMPYYLCFADVVARCAILGHITIPPQSIDLTFDQNYDRDPSTADLYNYLGSLKEWEFYGHLGERVTFADHRKETGIQVADLLARETMKHMENTMLEPRKRWARQSFVRLRTNPRIHVRFLDQQEFMEMSVTHPSALPESFMDDYRTWRIENGLQTDNLINRLRFMRLKKEDRTERTEEEDIEL